MKILLIGGGTGGHILPLAPLTRELREKKAEEIIKKINFLEKDLLSLNETILILPSGLRTVNLTSDPLSAPLINLTASVTPYPVTSTASLNRSLADRVPPSDLSNAVVINSICVISALPSFTARPRSATNTSGLALVLPLPDRTEPASCTQPLALAKTSFFSAVVRFLGLDSSVPNQRAPYD